jgi:hypothetical protein
MTLAVQLLQGSVAVIKAPEQQQLGGQSAQGRANGRSKLQRLAYCSLASSVVQACLHHEQPQSGWAVLLLGLASELLQAAGQEAAGSSTTSSTSSGGPQGQWGLAACIAASAAAGAYKLHLGAAGVEAPLSPGGWEDVDNSSREAETVCGFSAPTATTTTISSSSSRGAGGTEPDTPASQEGGSSPCPNNCSVWCSAIKLYAAFCCREHGIAFATPSDAAGVAALERAAQQRGNSPQQYLQQKLLALAWRHPVPGVCGNVLCGRLEGPSAVGQVRGPKGTLCGGCRAAWYCCKECQLVAWEAHRLVCGGGK